MRYAVVIEQSGTNFSAYVPNVSGCIANAAMLAATESEIRQAILFHPDGIREDGFEPPVPSTVVSTIDLLSACMPSEPRLT